MEKKILKIKNDSRIEPDDFHVETEMHVGRSSESNFPTIEALPRIEEQSGLFAAKAQDDKSNLTPALESKEDEFENR